MGLQRTLLAGNTLLGMCDNVDANVTQSKAVPQKARVSGNCLSGEWRDESVATNPVTIGACVTISPSEATSGVLKDTLNAMAVRLEGDGSGTSPFPLRLLDAGSGWESGGGV